MKTVIVSLLAIVAGLCVLERIGTFTWRRSVDRLVARLRAGTRRPGQGRFFTEELATLPAPVQRYFAFALSPGQRVVVSATTSSQGEFRMRLDGGWHPFTATQFFSVSPRAFVWEADINLAPLVHVNVTDRYLDGEGAINARAAAIVPVADEHGTPELAAGELLRYLAEGVMMPTALLPASGVSWTPIDEHSARATLADGGVTVSADFHFGLRDEIVRVSALRYRLNHGRLELTPWMGYFGEYRSIQGMMVPMEGHVAWILPGGEGSYYRGRTTNIAFELAA
jgi:hypothetical protein